MATIQGIYIALFGRPADTTGLAFFNAATKNGADLGAIGNLSGQKEYTDRFVGQSSSQIINSIYQSLFNRPGEQTGIDFYVAKLASGALTINNIAIAILDGALGSDKTTVDAKIAAADLFTSHLDLAIEQNAYSGNAAAAVGRTFITAVDATHLGTAATADAAILLLLNSAGQAPGGDGSTGGGDPQPDTVTYTPNSTVTPKDGQFLIVGNGNSPDGFAVTTNVTQGIELGLSVRYRFGEIIDNGIADGSHVVHFDNIDPSLARGLAIAYSASSLDGDALSANTFKLLVDIDGTAATEYKTFILEQSSPTHYNWVLDANNSGSIDAGDTVAIVDDEGNANATQNIQPLQFIAQLRGTEDVVSGDYSVKLQAFNGSSLLAQSEIALNIDAPDTAVVSSGRVASFDQTQLYVGIGNSPDGFAVTTLNDAGIQLGLVGRYAYPNPNVPSSTVLDGIVHYDVRSGSDIRFAYSIASLDNDKLSDNVFKLKIDIDPTDAQNYVTMTLTSDTGGNTYPNRSNSQYDWKIGNSVVIADDGGDSAGTVTQNSQNIAWYDNTDGSALAPGHYDVELQAWSSDGITLLGVNHVVFDVGPATL